MPKTFQFSVRTPEAEVVNTKAVSFKVGTELGPMVAYKGHANLTGAIPFSKLWVRTEDTEIEYLIRNGILFISLEQKSGKILCLSCEEMEDIDFKTAREYLQYVEEQLKKGADLNDFQLKFLKNEKIAMVRQLSTMEKK